LPAAWNHQGLANRKLAGVGETVGLHQPFQADAIAIGNFREGFAGFDHHIGHGGQGP
jgi:hypothetical protein